MRDVNVKINIKHRETFIKIIDKLDSNIKYKYTMTEKMNGCVSLNFIDDVKELVKIFPEDADFYCRLQRMIDSQKIQSPRKILIWFSKGE